MSATDSHDVHDLHGDPESGVHASLKGYLTGFVLAVILTAIPFWLVMGDVLPSAEMTGLAVVLFGIAQVFVHVVYFLHLDFRSENGWMMLAIIFALIIVFVIFVGSVWVMYHSNANMMPGMLEQGAQAIHLSS